jgi:hypothetical protein
MTHIIDVLACWVSVFAETYTQMYLTAIVDRQTALTDALFWLCQLIL